MVIVVVAAACGPSSKQMRAAKLAEYSASSATMFDIALQVAQENYKPTDIDAPGRRFATEPQFYSAEGGRQSPGKDGFVQYSEGSVILSLAVEVVQVGRRSAVNVFPKTFQMVTGSPKPRELEPDDPNLPPWVLGRVDALAFAIYERAREQGIVVDRGSEPRVPAHLAQ